MIKHIEMETSREITIEHKYNNFYEANVNGTVIRSHDMEIIIDHLREFVKDFTIVVKDVSVR